MFLTDVSVNSECEIYMKLFVSLSVRISKTKSMIIASALTIEDLSGRRFWIVMSSSTTESPTSMILEQSVYMCL